MKIVGIPTRIEGSFFVLSFFLGASSGRNLPLLLEWMLVVLISVLLHERHKRNNAELESGIA